MKMSTYRSKRVKMVYTASRNCHYISGNFPGFLSVFPNSSIKENFEKLHSQWHQGYTIFYQKPLLMLKRSEHFFYPKL